MRLGRDFSDNDCGCPVVTVDVVIFTLRDGDLQVLLIRRRRWPHEGMWAIPGGLVGPGETLEAAASRKLEEETGLTDVFLEQLYTFGGPPYCRRCGSCSLVVDGRSTPFGL
jgi:ADP-ribose pyrophosphatase YjhB (NUDIX family)